MNSSKLFRLFISCLLISVVHATFSQPFTAFKENGKWGFKQSDKIVIEAQYDTVFGFDAKQKIALVANLNPKKNFVNPLTKEIKKIFDYYYITPENKKIILVTADNKSVSELVNQQKLQKEYLLNSNYFKIMHDNKIYLFDKSGRQVTKNGFDNIAFTRCHNFFTTEVKDKSGQTYMGLIDENEKEIIPPTYSKITINMYDSLIICCTAGIKFNGSDDVFNYKGEKVSHSPRHIDYSFKNFTVYKIYDPRISFIIYEHESKKETPVEADALYYLKDENLVMKKKDNLFYYNFKTDKKTPYDKSLGTDYNINEQH